MFLIVVMVSCVSGALVYVLLRSRMSLQSNEEILLYVMVLRSCFNVNCCLCRISSCISLFNVYVGFLISSVWNWCMRWFLVRILCFVIVCYLSFLIFPFI